MEIERRSKKVLMQQLVTASLYMIVSGIALVVLISFDGGLEFGGFLNNYFPCQQNPMNSFPC